MGLALDAALAQFGECVEQAHEIERIILQLFPQHRRVEVSQELAKLAQQTRHVQNDFAAGVLTNQQITYILIALATAVIVLIAVR